MTPIFKFEGIYTPVVTPYQEDGRVNWDALSQVIEYLIEAGIHGLISGGSTGENYAQTVDERLELARFTHKQLDGRLPLVVGTGAMLTEDSVALASGARELEAAAILLASPPYSVPTDRENALNALAIDKAADLPIMLYNYPHRTGTMMGEEFLDRVGRSRQHTYKFLIIRIGLCFISSKTTCWGVKMARSDMSDLEWEFIKAVL
ncbi:dihydrodipicolinate synthase family protein, partial [Phaeobacter sp.]|uniref:dihydrodipicolinate synthase family protein n=1 Tax=Phaeobacter sp. TaxID=1902409 RepID=UPI0025CCC78B